MKIIRITAGDVCVRARLLDTPTASACWDALPINGTTETWGEELYFPAGVQVELEDDARAIVEAGEIAYWTDGESIAIGYGPTPISQDGEIRLAAPCNVFARALDDVRAFRAVGDGIPVTVEAET